MVARRIAVGVVVVVIVVSLTIALAYRYAYGTFAWWHGPEHISWCGRLYLPGPEMPKSRATIERRQADALAAQLAAVDPALREVWKRGHAQDPTPLSEVARIPPVVGDRLLAPVTGDGATTPCAMVVYLEVDEDAYRTYELSGGP